MAITDELIIFMDGVYDRIIHSKTELSSILYKIADNHGDLSLSKPRYKDGAYIMDVDIPNFGEKLGTLTLEYDLQKPLLKFDINYVRELEEVDNIDMGKFIGGVVNYFSNLDLIPISNKIKDNRKLLDDIRTELNRLMEIYDRSLGELYCFTSVINMGSYYFGYDKTKRKVFKVTFIDYVGNNIKTRETVYSSPNMAVSSDITVYGNVNIIQRLIKMNCMFRDYEEAEAYMKIHEKFIKILRYLN